MKRLLVLAGACLAAGLVAVPALAGDPSTVVMAPARGVELMMRPTDPAAARRCTPDWYKWPGGCDPDVPKGYSSTYSAGDRLENAYAPSGTYELTATLTLPDGKTLTATKSKVLVGERPTTALLVPTAGRQVGPALLFTLTAQRVTRDDGDICALPINTSHGCSSKDPRYVCSVKTDDGRMLKVNGCIKAVQYQQLIELLCAGKNHMLESEFAKRFTCE